MPAGTLGAIAVKRPDPVMFLGYWNKPEATRDKFIGDWLVTGDWGGRTRMASSGSSGARTMSSPAAATGSGRARSRNA